MIDVFCFVAACTIVVVSTLGCAGTIAVVGFKFVENISANVLTHVLFHLQVVMLEKIELDFLIA